MLAASTWVKAVLRSSRTAPRCCTCPSMPRTTRMEAARAARRFPLILERLADGSVHLTAVRILAPHLTADNHRAVLEAARHKTKREIELLIACCHPRPDVPASVRKLSTPASTGPLAETPPVDVAPTVKAAATRATVDPAPLAWSPVVSPLSMEVTAEEAGA